MERRLSAGGLEVARVEGLEYNRYAEGLQHVTPEPARNGTANGPYRIEQFPEKASPQNRICGLPRTSFWVILALIIAFIIGGAIGGGIGGSLAAKKSTNSQTSIPASITSSAPVTSTSATSTSGSQESITASTTASAPVTSGTSGLAANPCPGINQTIVTGSTGSAFTVLCGVDWPRGIQAMNGKGKVSDLGRSTVYSIQECIDRCLGSHKDDCKGVTYSANLTSSFDGGQDGNCFFKDQAGIYFAGGDTIISAGIIGG
ncbi:hypothetical protein BDV24DRAFT_131592 [Aspergillus arachidicola]|uniref:Uncharacterized protein n=1 Tax=Aspergillus arachidicola TaxID=656916 RepID=A0A2G7FEN3_9EURO|nr:hypothetical protein BDV24DRAFT_131592 [Aspergillus arachidicola]PIG79023.1 hypothetical protein AARAC_003589 [Aspergillus arachidicola]